ncbi:MAG: hypothetical protein ABEJ05_04305 [Haloglomus sp.]
MTTRSGASGRSSALTVVGAAADIGPHASERERRPRLAARRRRGVAVLGFMCV